MNREQRRTLINLIDAQADVIISQLGDNYSGEEYELFLTQYSRCQDEFLDALSDEEFQQMRLDL